MNGELIAFEIVLIVPLFVATWRTSLLGLATQGALMAWMVLHHHGTHLTLATAVELFDLVVVRMCAAPLALYLVLRRQNVPRRNDVIAPNLFSWAIALALILMAFRLADTLVPIDGDPRTVVAVSTSAVLLGLLVLSTRSGTFSQVVGVLRVENGIALFEIGAAPPQAGLGIRVAQVVLFACSVGFLRWYLIHLHADEGVPPIAEGAVL